MNNGNDDRIIRKLDNLKVGGITNIIKLTGAQIGVDGATYASGDVLGDKCPIEVKDILHSTTEGYGSGIIQSVITGDLSNQSGAYDIIFFDALPVTVFTDNAACDIADADIPKIIAIVPIVAGDYFSFVDNSVGVTSNIAKPIQSLAGTGTTLWIALVSRDTKTYVADELSINIGILQD